MITIDCFDLYVAWDKGNCFIMMLKKFETLFLFIRNEYEHPVRYLPA